MTAFEARASLRAQAASCRARADEMKSLGARHYLLVAAEKLERAAMLAYEAEHVARRAELYEKAMRGVP